MNSLKLLAAAALGCVGVAAQAAPLAVQYEVQLRATESALREVGVPDALAGTAARSSITVGEISERADVSAERYTAQSSFVPGGTIGPFIKNAAFMRSSQGAVAQGMQQMQAFQDARSGKPRVISRFDAASKTVSAQEGAKTLSKVAVKGNLVDLLGLQYAFAGRPKDIKAFSGTLATGKGFSPASFAVQTEEVTIAGSKVPAIRLYRAPAADGGLEIWYRASDGVPLMSRISLSAKYGATLTATAKTLPPAFKF
jgi:hypothetical protein